jgi:hypothetical protein
MPMSITVLCVTNERWKQHKHPSIGEWISKVQYIYTMEYSELKANTVLCYNIILRKIGEWWILGTGEG